MNPPSDPSSDRRLSALVRRSLKEALARWVVRHRAPRPSWLRPQDEAIHRWDGRRHFAEDYVFTAVQRDLGLILRLEWLPGRASHRLWVIVFENGAVHTLPGSGQILLRGGDAAHWRVGGLELDCLEPFARWQLRYRGPLDHRSADGQPQIIRDPAGARRVARVDAHLDLTFLAESPPYIPGTDDDPELLSRSLGDTPWDTSLLRSLRRRQLRSYVQVGELAGSLALGERLLAFDGAALRMHSWGVRDWGASDSAFQCFLARGGHPYLWIHRARFPWLTLEGGFVVDEAGLTPITDLGITLERRPEAAPRRVSVDVDVAHGGRRAPLTAEGECRSQIALDMDGRGRLDLAFLQEAGISGIWVGQRRTLPRPARRDP